MQRFNQDDYITDKFNMWDEDINEYDSENEKPWFGIDSNSGDGYSSGAGSSCRAICGGSFGS